MFGGWELMVYVKVGGCHRYLQMGENHQSSCLYSHVHQVPKIFHKAHVNHPSIYVPKCNREWKSLVFS